MITDEYQTSDLSLAAFLVAQGHILTRVEGPRGGQRTFVFPPSGRDFVPDEGARLAATAQSVYPRWHPFLLTGLLAGLRSGESAALYKEDIDWRKGRIHVQRAYSDKANEIGSCKSN